MLGGSGIKEFCDPFLGVTNGESRQLEELTEMFPEISAEILLRIIRRGGFPDDVARSNLSDQFGPGEWIDVVEQVTETIAGSSRPSGAYWAQPRGDRD